MNAALSLVYFSGVLTTSLPATDALRDFTDLHEATRHSLSELKRQSPSSFSPGSRLITAVDFRGEWQQAIQRKTRQTLLAAAYGFLDGQSLRIHAPLTPRQIQEQAGDFSKAAQDQGADWLLLFTLHKLQDHRTLRGHLEKVEFGLWTSRPRPSPVYARIKLQIVQETQPALRSAATPDSFRKRHELKERIVAMANCELDDSSPSPEVITLSGVRIVVFRVSDDVLLPLSVFNLRDLPRAAARSRAPIGRLECWNAGESKKRGIRFAHSDLRHAYTIDIDTTAGRIRFSNKRELKGSVLYLSPEKTLRAEYKRGQPFWGSPPTLLGKRAFLMLPRPRNVSSTHGLALILDHEYKLEILDDKQELHSTPLSSGLGFSVFQTNSDLIRLVSTSSQGQTRGDLIRIQDLDSPAVLHQWKSPEAVFASTVLPLNENLRNTLFVAGYSPSRGHSSIYSLEFAP